METRSDGQSSQISSKQAVESSVIVLNSGSKEMDTTIASFLYENSISFNVADWLEAWHATKKQVIIKKP